MTDKNTLYSGVSRAAWGYFFLYFDINLGTVSILPSFIGMLLFLSSIKLLKDERRDFALLRPLGILLAVWYAGDWLASWLGGSLDGHLVFLDLIISLARMYFHFQLFTDFAALAVKYQSPGDSLDKRLLRWRTLQTVILAAVSLTTCMAQWLSAWWEYVTFAMAIIYLIGGLCLMMALFAFRKVFRES